MRVLLTGGSGTVGSHVLDILCKNYQHEITVFDIKTSKTKKFYKSFKGKIKTVFGDIADENDLNSACKDMDIAIHLAAVIPPLADKNPNLAYRVNVLGTKNLINALEKQSKNAFFIYASSVSVYGDRLANPEIKVSDKLHPSEGDSYAVTKIQAEKIVKECKLDWVIFRLSAIMGINNHEISGLMFQMPLDTKIEITTPQDAANAFIFALTSQNQLSKQVFNLGGGKNCRISYQNLLSRSFLISGLGKLDFPNHTFATKNFHCGYYADGDELEDILHFRTSTIESYFEDMHESVSACQKISTHFLRNCIKNNLIKKSEPYEAFLSGDPEKINHFFDPAAK